jgi:hypothetical protein
MLSAADVGAGYACAELLDCAGFEDARFFASSSASCNDVAAALDTVAVRVAAFPDGHWATSGWISDVRMYARSDVASMR